MHETEIHPEGANLELNKNDPSEVGHKPWSGCRCFPKTGPGSALASLASRTHP